MITLRNITKENFWEIIELKVSEPQKELVTSNAVSIAQSKIQPECIPLGIYEDEEAFGFIMYCIDTDDGEYWIYRLMIDERYQRRGYAKEAMTLLIKEFRRIDQRTASSLASIKEGRKQSHYIKVSDFYLPGKVSVKRIL